MKVIRFDDQTGELGLLVPDSDDRPKGVVHGGTGLAAGSVFQIGTYCRLGQLFRDEDV